MHILLITTYFEPDSGAAAVRLSRLARLLHARGHQITVLAALPHYPQGRVADAYRGAWTTTEERDGLRIVRAWLYATPKTSIVHRLISQNSFMLTAVLRGIALPRPDVVLIEAQPVFTSVAGVVLSRLKGVPYVFNVSDPWPEYLLAVGVLAASHPLYRVFKAIVNATQRGAAGMVALYPHILDTIEARIGPGRNRRVIYNAVDLKRFRPDLDSAAFRARHGLGDEKLIVFIGTFGTHIDFATMLDAAAHFNDRDDVRFVFVGTGGQREKVAERVARGDLSRAKWIGWVDHAEMPVVWAAAYLAFWAVHNHTLYRSILQAKIFEAMASGVPVAVAVEGITTDLVTRSGAGETVPFADTPALVHAIERFVSDPDYRARCAAAARDYAETHFDPERGAAQYEDVLEAARQR